MILSVIEFKLSIVSLFSQCLIAVNCITFPVRRYFVPSGDVHNRFLSETNTFDSILHGQRGELKISGFHVDEGGLVQFCKSIF